MRDLLNLYIAFADGNPSAAVFLTSLVVLIIAACASEFFGKKEF